MVRVLIVEDDASTAAYLSEGLLAHGHEVRRAADGREGLKLAQDAPSDVLVVDRLLPQIDGLSLVRALRTAGVSTPVLFLTALGGLSDKVEGLGAGGDDYLVKPFDLPELVARVEALGRRQPLSADPNVIVVSDVRLDRRAHAAWRGASALELTPREFRILELLMLNVGRPVTRAMMVERALDLDADSPGSLVEPHVSRLRTKLLRAGGHDRIQTVRSVGYVLVAD